MNKKGYGMLATLAALALSGESYNNPFPIDDNKGTNKLILEDIEVTPKEPPVPSGCKRHYFDKYGPCPKGEHLVYFDAMKKQSALIKWERWLNTQSVIDRTK